MPIVVSISCPFSSLSSFTGGSLSLSSCSSRSSIGSKVIIRKKITPSITVVEPVVRLLAKLEISMIEPVVKSAVKSLARTGISIYRLI
jgi:hypothetical protein